MIKVINLVSLIAAPILIRYHSYFLVKSVVAAIFGLVVILAVRYSKRDAEQNLEPTRTVPQSGKTAQSEVAVEVTAR